MGMHTEPYEAAPVEETGMAEIDLETLIGGIGDVHAAIAETIAREAAREAVASLCGFILHRAREAKEKGVSRAGHPIESKEDALLSAFAEALVKFGSEPEPDVEAPDPPADEDTVEEV